MEIRLERDVFYAVRLIPGTQYAVKVGDQYFRELLACVMHWSGPMDLDITTKRRVFLLPSAGLS